MTRLSKLKISQFFFILLLLLIIWLSFKVLRPFLTSILLSIVLTYYFYPVYKALLKGVKRRSLASLLTILLIIIIILPFLVYVLLKLSTEAVTAYKIVGPTYKGITKEYLTKILEGPLPIKDLLTTGLAQLAAFTKSNATKIISSVSNAVLQLFIFFFVMYFLFKDGPALFIWIKEVLPLKEKQKRVLVKELRQMVHGVIHGQFTTALVQGIAGTVGFLIFGVPNPFFWGFIMFVLSFLPVVGAPIVWIPGGLWLLFGGKAYSAIGLWLYGLLLVSNIDNFLKPKLIGNSTKLHPLLIFLGVLGGLHAFGFSGILLGPMVFLLLTVMVRFYKEENYRLCPKSR